MNRQILIAGVVAVLVAVVAITMAIGVVIGTAIDDDHHDRISERDGDDPFLGMMGAMGGLDTDDMLGHMGEVLNDEDYALMLEHMEEHREGDATGNASGVDGMMHRMMDGMLGHMPSTSDQPGLGDPDHHSGPRGD
jgi:hypothetical protein